MIGANFNTDKSSDYLLHYENYFSLKKNEEINLLEIGVYKGGSLNMWSHYFKKGKIVGIDQDYYDNDNEKIKFYQGSQEDLDFLNFVATSEVNSCGFDIIIDDASHIGHITRKTFWYLFDNHLKSGGIYVIEDWGTGYWDNWPDGSRYNSENHTSGMVSFIKELIDECAMDDITSNINNFMTKRTSKFKSMVVTNGLVFVFKK